MRHKLINKTAMCLFNKALYAVKSCTGLYVI